MLRPSGPDDFSCDEHERSGAVASDSQLLTSLTSGLCLVLRKYVSLGIAEMRTRTLLTTFDAAFSAVGASFGTASYIDHR